MNTKVLIENNKKNIRTIIKFNSILVYKKNKINTKEYNKYKQNKNK